MRDPSKKKIYRPFEKYPSGVENYFQGVCGVGYPIIHHLSCFLGDQTSQHQRFIRIKTISFLPDLREKQELQVCPGTETA